MDEYLTIDELSSRIKYTKQSLYNMVSKNIFILGKHYFKPTPKKILFKWSEIQAWIEGPIDPNDGTPAIKSANQNTCENKPTCRSVQDSPNSSINI
jgi:predicted DNA-binding transcriptional regulator AlpA